MEVLVNNRELLIVFGLIISVLILGLLVVPWAKRNDYIDNSDTQFTKELLKLLKLLMYELNLKEDMKNQTVTLFKIAEIAVNYVETNLDLQGQDIEDVSYQTVLELLDEFEIEITDERMKLIELGIRFAVNKLNKS